MTTTQVQNFRLSAALAYAEKGWLVIPLHNPLINPSGKQKCSCGEGGKCGSIGKHPRTMNGLTGASTNPDLIRSWWEKWPAANIGLCAGAVSGFVVVDVDSRHGGEVTLAKLMDEHGELPETIEQETGGGGFHLLFAHPGFKVKNDSKGKMLGPGLDVRGDGGYIVAPPSLHSSGKRYAWKPGASPAEHGLSALPKWIGERVKDIPEPPKAVSERSSSEIGRHWLGQALAKVTDGTRNDTGYWLACQLRDNRVSELDAAGLMRDFCGRVPQGSSTYTEKEAAATLRSAYGTPAREPAQSISFSSKIIKAVAATTPEPATGASAQLQAFYSDVQAGKIYNVPFPWELMTKLSQALLPGTITCVCGDPGVGKTFYILQCLQFWHGNGFNPAVYFIEKNRLFHTRRLLAQIEHRWDYVDLDWAKKNHEDIKKAIDRNAYLIDELGKCIWSESNERVTLDSLLGWIRQMASAGKRVLVIDPITAAAAGAERWSKDDDFVIAAQKVLIAHGSSLILITHAKKGNRPGAPTGHDMAAGAAYYRFADCAIWLVRPKKLRKVIYQSAHGAAKGRFSLFAHLHKTRDGAGWGAEIAMTLADGGWYTEQGIVLQDDKSDDQQEAA